MLLDTLQALHIVAEAENSHRGRFILRHTWGWWISIWFGPLVAMLKWLFFMSFPVENRQKPRNGLG